MCLFPNYEECATRIQNFPNNEATIISQIRLQFLDEVNVENIQTQLIRTLGRWGAFRNQGGERNEEFLNELFNNNFLRNSFYDLFRVSFSEKTLSNILLFYKEKIFIIYSYLQNSILSNNVLASIMTVSKAMLMTVGTSVGFDSRVLTEINNACTSARFSLGIWSFDLFYEALRYVAFEQNKWELMYGSMKNLDNNLPICQIIDRILWMRE